MNQDQPANNARPGAPRQRRASNRTTDTDGGPKKGKNTKTDLAIDAAVAKLVAEAPPLSADHVPDSPNCSPPADQWRLGGMPDDHHVLAGPGDRYTQKPSAFLDFRSPLGEGYDLFVAVDRLGDDHSIELFALRLVRIFANPESSPVTTT